MSYRALTVCHEDIESVQQLTRVAANLADIKPAETQTTSVHCVHVKPSGSEYIAMSPYVQAVPLTRLYDRYDDIARHIKQACQQEQKQYSTAINWHWHEHDGFSLGDFTPYIQHAMVSDLVICSKPPNMTLGAGMPRALVTESGAPVLVVPADQTTDLRLSRITVAWNETAESAAALRHALPLLKQAQAVVVLNVSRREQSNELTGADIGRYLSDHDIKANIDQKVSSQPIGDVLLEHGNDNFTDLLIMGGFGHSSLYNIAFGAATPQVLKELPIPVLMSR